jgi:hypothetical protein
MSGKNWCQNPECAGRETGRYHRITNTFRSKYACHDRPDSYWAVGKYFCSTTCSGTWLENHIEMIFDRKILPPKIIERKSVPAEEYDSTKSVRVASLPDSNGYPNYNWKDVPCKRYRVVSSNNT